MNPVFRHLLAAFAAVAVVASGSVLAQTTTGTPPATAVKPAVMTRVGAAKLIIGDLKTNQAYYESIFGMKEVMHYAAEGVYDESIMAFAGSTGASLALFEPKAEKPIKKSSFPVVLIYTPEFDAVTKRIEDAKLPLQRLPTSQSGTFKIAIARDPSGNAVEILSRPGKPWEVGGAKLIVSDRQKAEDFFTSILGARAGTRYQTKTYDEVLMTLGDGAFIALFQPLAEAPLPKSGFPVVAVRTAEFDAMLARVKAAGLAHRDVKSAALNSPIFNTKDPAGNSVEIIKQ